MDKIGAGSNHTLINTGDEYAWACGENSYCQLGRISIFRVKAKIKRVKDIPEVRAVAAGLYFSLFIDKENFVWACGDNNHGQLGVNKKSIGIDFPTKIKNVSNVRAVDCEYHHSLLLDEEGNVWSSGNNEQGQLGLGDNLKRRRPEKIEGLPPIKAVSCGNHFSMFLDVNGVVWTAGEIKMYSQHFRQNMPALIPGLESIKQISSGGYHSVCINYRDELIVCGQVNARGVSDPTIVSGPPPIVQVSLSHDRSLFLDAEGSLWGSGKNIFNDLAIGEDWSQIKKYSVEEEIGPFNAVSSGFDHAVLTSVDGSIYTAGSNENGALGLGSVKITSNKFNRIPGLSVLGSGRPSLKSARNI